MGRVKAASGQKGQKSRFREL